MINRRAGQGFLRNPARVSLLLAFVLLVAACSPMALPEGWPGITASGAPQDGGWGAYQDGQYVYVAYRNVVFRVDTQRGQDGNRFDPKQPPTSRLIDWAAPAPGGVQFFTAPAVGDDGTLYLGAYNHAVYAYSPNANPRNAAITTFQANPGTDRVIADALVYKNRVYVGQGDKGIRALDPKSGQILSEFKNTRFGVWAAPAVDKANDVLYVPSLDQRIYALNAEDLSYIWEVQLEGQIASTPLLAPDGLLYVGTLASELFVVDPKIENRGTAPTILHRCKLDGWLWSTPVWRDGKLFFGDMKGSVYSLDVSQSKTAARDSICKPLWKATNSESGGVRGKVAVADVDDRKMVVAALESKILRAYDMETGAPIWVSNPPTEDRILSNLIVIGDEVIFTTMSENQLLVAYDLRVGGRKWSVAKPNDEVIRRLAVAPQVAP